MRKRWLQRRRQGVYLLHMSKPAAASQKKIANGLKIKLTGQSTRVLAAQILDSQEDQALAIAKKLKLVPGVRVT